MAEASVAVFENLLNLGLPELSVFGRLFLYHKMFIIYQK
jgi:hypothetical protein